MASPITIEKSVPIPEKRPGRLIPGGVTDTLRSMTVGDSVVIPRHRYRVWYERARQIGIKVSVRKVTGSEARIWRVA